uniref:HDC07384 n=1 Tax=Drosophila melanogaster TaxID=7227 RepID=Q6IG33_DROME|nr:TPA_inf: HDC07384 [Drosophila melanogaster]
MDEHIEICNQESDEVGQIAGEYPMATANINQFYVERNGRPPPLEPAQFLTGYPPRQQQVETHFVLRLLIMMIITRNRRYMCYMQRQCPAPHHPSNHLSYPIHIHVRGPY